MHPQDYLICSAATVDSGSSIITQLSFLYLQSAVYFYFLIKSDNLVSYWHHTWFMVCFQHKHTARRFAVSYLARLTLPLLRKPVPGSTLALGTTKEPRVKGAASVELPASIVPEAYLYHTRQTVLFYADTCVTLMARRLTEL